MYFKTTLLIFLPLIVSILNLFIVCTCVYVRCGIKCGYVYTIYVDMCVEIRCQFSTTIRSRHPISSSVFLQQKCLSAELSLQSLVISYFKNLLFEEIPMRLSIEKTPNILP